MDELRTALNLATDEELQHLTQILFSRKFNPLDYFQTPQPIFVQTQHRDRQIESIERRFRHLAADGFTVLLGQAEMLSYREILLQVCHFLKLSSEPGISTTDLEAEIFLHLTGKAWRKLPAAEKKSLLHRVQRSLERDFLPEPLPVQLQHNPVQILLRGGSTIAVSTILKTAILKNIARQFALYFASSHMTKVAAGGAGKLATVLSSQAAKKGLATTALKYGAMRSVFSVVVPAMWGWFLADLGWRAIATNYGRIIPMIVTLAQIRLTREEIVWQEN
ncbi:YaaW family protein [[Limnothrix rosea] IAM M-220]|uniref:YaaW family protein n=1 Tax=[Limnothrix rosea] IAM M-220 TaxID=454133 RepID=UPI0009635631|nr:YaaW family protein [[Limnothrix rosea] IAM M-220]OKH18008.1 hypothetical protein NIES208_07520 [[Limnothrix rosea] IAM M-220]